MSLPGPFGTRETCSAAQQQDRKGFIAQAQLFRLKRCVLADTRFICMRKHGSVMGPRFIVVLLRPHQVLPRLSLRRCDVPDIDEEKTIMILFGKCIQEMGVACTSPPLGIRVFGSVQLATRWVCVVGNLGIVERLSGCAMWKSRVSFALVSELP